MNQKLRRALPLFLAFLLLTFPLPSMADQILVATASNFRDTMEALVHRFEQKSGHSVVPIYGSTGKHYAQIINGAPYDAFFAADRSRPERLERDGAAVRGSRFTYAVGRLVLWSPRAGYVDPKGEILRTGSYRHMAIANPDLAPYGVAAMEVLQHLGLWQEIQPRLVLGENIGQAFLFVRSGNAELGLVAWSQLLSTASDREGSSWRVPETFYRPIEQQAVLISDKEAARAFMSFIHGAEADRIIQAHGYSTTTSKAP